MDHPVESQVIVVRCPRCYQHVRYLVQAYWKPPDHPGFCSVCCGEAGLKFDRDGWPEGEVS